MQPDAQTQTDAPTNPDAQLSIRPTAERDVAAIHDLIGRVYREYDCVLNVEEDYYLQRPGPYFREHGGDFWVLEDEAGRILATVAVMLDGDTAELKTLYVDPSLRRRGWARRLVRLTMDYARQAGARRMILWSDTRFVEAHALYRSTGFRQLDRTRDLNDSNRSVEYGFEQELA